MLFPRYVDFFQFKPHQLDHDITRIAQTFSIEVISVICLSRNQTARNISLKSFLKMRGHIWRRFAPFWSYIHVEDFESPGKLARKKYVEEHHLEYAWCQISTSFHLTNPTKALINGSDHKEFVRTNFGETLRSVFFFIIDLKQTLLAIN